MVTFYLIGVLIAFILGCILIYKEERKKKEKDKPQYGMIFPFSLMSWISVVLILWRYRLLLS